jgi:hypothetical protein
VSEGKEGGRESKKLECVLGGEWLKKVSVCDKSVCDKTNRHWQDSNLRGINPIDF